MSKKTVSQIMKNNPITLQCHTSLTDIVKTLISSQQSQLPVVNNEKKLLGMVSLVGCQKALLSSAYHCDKPVQVDNVMATNFNTFNADEDLSEVAIKTQHLSDNILPVVKGDKLIGIMKRTDLLTHLQNNLSLCSQKQL
jgi:predicted transcriptional regulator